MAPTPLLGFPLPCNSPHLPPLPSPYYLGVGAAGQWEGSPFAALRVLEHQICKDLKDDRFINLFHKNNTRSRLYAALSETQYPMVESACLGILVLQLPSW